MANDWRSSGNAILQYSFLHVFANDATIDARELAMIERLALKDGTVDDQERKVLGRIFARIDEQNVSKDVWDEICRFKSEHRIA
jgi:hypothetical protein